jgi:hypothetical protein
MTKSFDFILDLLSAERFVEALCRLLGVSATPIAPYSQPDDCAHEERSNTQQGGTEDPGGQHHTFFLE